jgi:hypothetical protein
VSAPAVGPASPDGLIADLLACGYSPVEIERAFRVLENATETIRRALPLDVTSARAQADATSERFGPVLPRRFPSSVESIRMTEEAVRLYNDWQSLKLLSPLEAEEILRQVVMIEDGEIDTIDLVRIARDSARPGSDLSLHLSTQNAPIQ